jgi:uncharacterized protein
MRVPSSVVLVLSLLCTGPATAGPEDSSRFDATPYSAAQKVVYDVNFANPSDLKAALNTVKAHIRTLREFGNPQFSIVMVAHGNEVHALSRLNRAAFPDIYAALKELTDQGAAVHICNGAAAARGYKPDQFYDLATVVPIALTDIARLEGEGYSYINLNLFSRMTRDELVQRNPELKP